MLATFLKAPLSGSRPLKLRNCFILLAGLLCCSCELSPTNPKILLYNPYQFSQGDIVAVDSTLEDLLQARRILDSSGELHVNPYQFRLIDTLSAHESTELAEANLVALRAANCGSNYQCVISRFISSLPVINTGLSYWRQERNVVLGVATPYWNQELAYANWARDPQWISFCQEQIDIQALRLEMIDVTLDRLFYDSLLMRGIFFHSPQEIVEEKIHREELMRDYHKRVLAAIVAATGLEIADFSALMAFIQPLETVPMAAAYWTHTIETIDAAEIPFWQSEAAEAERVGDSIWQVFSETMGATSADKRALAELTISDLRQDSLWAVGASEESVLEIKYRKLFLNDEQVQYYGVLADAIRQGLSLAILRGTGEI